VRAEFSDHRSVRQSAGEAAPSSQQIHASPIRKRDQLEVSEIEIS
jgi:hypothetical protein